MSDLFLAYDRWGGLVTILCGIYACLLAYGYLPRNPKDPEAHRLWQKKFGGMLQVLGPLIVLGGVFTLITGLSTTPPNPAVKRVFSKFANANEERASRGTSLQSAELYLAKLKSIDLTEAPDDLRKAVTDYTKALAEGLAALKNGKPTKAADEKLMTAKTRLEEIEADNRKDR